MKTIKSILVIVIALAVVMLPVSASAQVWKYIYDNSITQRDTLTIPELYDWFGTASLIGMWCYCPSTTDDGAPENEACQIVKHTSTTGLVILDIAGDADLGFSADVDDGDYIFISATVPEGYKIRASITAAQPATGVAQLDYMLFISNLADSILAALTTTMGNQWGTATAPANGVAFDEALLYNIQKNDSLYNWLNSTRGLNAWPTGVFPAAGISFAEVIKFVADSLRKINTSTDSTLFYLHSTTGAPAVTGAFPAAGISVLERIGFLCDSLRSVKVSVDSVWNYLGTTKGAQWGTPAEPAAGVSLLEGLGYEQNQIDTLTSWLGTTSGIAADPTGIFHANGVNVIERINFIQDSLRVLRTTTDSTWNYLATTKGAQWGTATEPANGVNLFEGLGFLQNQMDTVTTVKLEYAEQMQEDVRDSLEDANNLLQSLTGANKLNVWSQPLMVIIDLTTGTTWETAGTHEVLTVTGNVEFEITCYDSIGCTSASTDSLWFFLGESGATGYRAFSFMAEDAVAGDNLIPTVHSPGYIWSAAALTTNAGGIWKGSIFGGKDIGYEISDHAFTAGQLVLYCRWRGDGSVVAGGGGGL